MRGEDQVIRKVDFRRSLPPVAASFGGALALALNSLSTGNERLNSLMHESHARGTEAERAAGVRFLSPRLGADVSVDRMLITNGTQSVLMLLFRKLVGASGLLLTESLTYGALRPLARECAIRVQGVAIDDEGIIPDAFEVACRTSRPQALYCNPTMHNPTTATMSLPRRWALIEIARKYGVTIIEDEALGRLYPDAPQPLATLAPEICWYVMSTTKCLSHGVRLAYAVAPSTSEAEGLLATAEQLSFWVPMPLILAVMTRWCDDGTADLITDEIAQECTRRQKKAAQTLEGLDVRAPMGAMHIWVSLHDGRKAREFADYALETGGVLLRAASHFTPDDALAPECLRLSLSTPASPEEAESGLATLRKMLAMQE